MDPLILTYWPYEKRFRLAGAFVAIDHMRAGRCYGAFVYRASRARRIGSVIPYVLSVN